MYAGIPTYCLNDFFRLCVERRRLVADLEAESFVAGPPWEPAVEGLQKGHLEGREPSQDNGQTTGPKADPILTVKTPRGGRA